MGRTRKAINTEKLHKQAPKAAKKAPRLTQSQCKKTKSQTGQLWDHNKVEIGQILSEVQYMQVDAIKGNDVDFKTKTGAIWTLSGQSVVENLTKDAYSADHYEREVKCTMTDLARIITSNKGTIFKV